MLTTPVFNRVGCLVLLAAVCLSFGCQRDYVRPGDMVEIRGKVTLDGRPVADARVVFVPQNATLSSQFLISYGTTDNRGEFELATRDDQEGALVGKHLVIISRADYSTNSKPKLQGPVFTIDANVVRQDVNEAWSILNESIQQQPDETIPFYYNLHSDLTIDVVPGRGIQDVNFELVSVDPLLQQSPPWMNKLN